MILTLVEISKTKSAFLKVYSVAGAFYSLFTGFLLFRFSIGSSARHYCQPGESCWPTVEEVEQFKSYLSPADDEECHSLPTFSSFDEPGKLPIKHILLFKF